MNVSPTTDHQSPCHLDKARRAKNAVADVTAPSVILGPAAARAVTIATAMLTAKIQASVLTKWLPK